jgi:heme-degrading monooxygenase HmoA
MYIAMNRFRIVLGREDDFLARWTERDSHLSEVPGYVEFRLLRGESDEECTLFATHTTWQDEAAFRDWTNSEHFRQAHANAGGGRDLYLGHPVFEGFEVALEGTPANA